MSFNNFGRPGLRGFSFIQIMIALAIIGIALVPASYLFLSSNRQVVKSQATLEAMIAAQSLSDKVCSDKFIMNNLGKTINVPDENYPDLVMMSHFREKFKARAEISFQEAPTLYNQRNLRIVDVNVIWNENGNTIESSLVTMKANINDIMIERK
jgi:type II secretory pathway pseudopilin PulG